MDADHAFSNQPSAPGNISFLGRKASVDFINFAAFAEVSDDNPIAKILVGARFEHHSQFGSSFVPRLAVTKLFEPFHVKLLYAQAFKTPPIENISTNAAIQPERSRTVEAEVGWQLARSAFLSANVFDTSIDRDIILAPDDSASGVLGSLLYKNAGTTGWRGAELDLRCELPWGSAAMSYSYYTTAGINGVEAYAVPGHDNLLLGLGAHKVTARARVPVGAHLVVTPTVQYVSDRYGYVSLDANGNPVAGSVGAKVFANVFASWRDLFAKGVEVGAGVYDLLDEGQRYPIPCRLAAGLHPPMPGPTREFMLRVSYNP